MGVFDAFRTERLVDKIIEVNDADSEDTKRLAAKLRGKGPAAIPLIIDALDIADREHTVLFVDILGDLLNNKSLPEFIEGLKHENATVISSVTWALTKEGCYDPNELIDFLDGPGVPKAPLLELISHHRDRISVNRLMHQAYSLDSAQKTGVFKIIGDLADETIVSDLIARASGKDTEIRSQIIKILSRFNRPDVQDALQSQLSDRNKDVREAALDALIGMDSEHMDVEKLCELLRDPDLNIQQKAVDVIVNVNHPDTTRHLVAALKDESEYARRAAVEILNEIGTPENIKQLLEAVQDEDWWVRARSADALAKIGGPKVVNAVIRLIKDDDEAIRRSAIEILNSIKDPKSMKHLIEAVEDTDWWVRERAVDALAEIGSNEAIPALIGMLGKHQESVPVVIRALGKIGGKQVLQPLLQQLEVDSKTIKVEALTALAQVGDEDNATVIRKALVKHTADGAAEVKRAASAALKELDHRLTAERVISVTGTRPAVAGSAIEATNETKTLLIDERELEKTLADAKMQEQLDILNLEPGEMIDPRYRFIKRIGKGAFGTVLLVEDSAVDEQIVLKFLNSQISSDDEMMKRFVYELRYSRKITHQNVIRIFDFLNLGGQYAISMEFFDSHPLGAEVVDRKPMPLKRALGFAMDIATGMREAHKVGIVHRDLKPPNILINDDDLLKIVDFGVAAAQSSGDTALTKTGYVIGSPKYMAPEQILGKKVNHTADIYSLGVILYEMVTGAPPFSEGDHMAVMYAHVQGNADAPHSRNPDLPAEVSEVIQKAMSRQQEDRFQSMEEFQTVLKSLSEQFGAA